MTVVINGTTGISTPGLSNSSTTTNTGNVTNSGTVTNASTISVGNATPSASGAGITFPATLNASTDANTLDDYEEGTWTPTLSSSGYTLGHAYQNGWYVKIGQFVWLGGTVGLNSKSGSGTAIVYLANLPFAAAGGQANEISALTLGYTSAWSTAYPTTGYLIQNASAINLQALNVATGAQGIIGTYLSSTSYMNFTISYRCSA